VTRRPPLEEVFKPRGIAVIGVTHKNPESYGAEAVRSLKEAAFPGIYPINPHYTEFDGLPCYANLQAVPEPVDHVICCLPAGQALSVVADAAAKGVRSIHFFTAGFSESGDADRAALEKELIRRAVSAGIRVIGPNCMGVYVPGHRWIAWQDMSPEAGRIGLMTQSGGHGQDIPVYGAPRGLRFSTSISYGNALDVDAVELLDYFRRDPETEIIALYLEGVKDGESFRHALAAAAAVKPVVIYKGGVTESGTRATLGHTASLVNSERVFAALCRQYNVMRAADMDELIDLLVALCYFTPYPTGDGVAIVGRGGGPSVLTSDEMELAGLRVPPVTPEARQELGRWLPLDGSIMLNPVDSAPLFQGDTIRGVMGILARLPRVDLLVYHLGFHSASRWGHGQFDDPARLKPMVAAMQAVRDESGKPIALFIRPAPDQAGSGEFQTVRDAFVRAGFPVFHNMRQGARAIAGVIRWRQRLDQID